MDSEAIDSYLEAIEVTRVVKTRVLEVLDFYKHLLGEPLQAVLVTEVVSDEGQRIYGSLWVFTNSLACEALQFLNQDQFQVDDIANKVHYLKVVRQDYEPRSANSKSRLTITYAAEPALTGELAASGVNCDFLFNVLKQQLLPNLRSGVPVPPEGISTGGAPNPDAA